MTKAATTRPGIERLVVFLIAAVWEKVVVYQVAPTER